MNYLAHIFLARQSDAAMIGAMLGDFAKASVDGLYTQEIEREIMLHRYIDSYTDSHPVVKSAVQLFAGPRRRYGGIVLDVFYDHLLTQRWDHYSELPRHELIARFHRALREHMDILPDKLRAIAPRIIEQNWLAGYEELAGVELAVTRISQRLSRNGHLMREGLDDLRANYAAIAAGFDAFFPDLMRFAEQRRSELIQLAMPR
ncbi:ACP phosphodiesterase [Pseudoduganella sp. LjRoot289]|uniref:acyl carrier protein phosphodiesterase n=1 Tax=Pseudoduganella sp. LjRoot289 TaxID=3342314 RepID=UPI003ECF613E